MGKSAFLLCTQKDGEEPYGIRYVIRAAMLWEHDSDIALMELKGNRMLFLTALKRHD